MWRTDLLGDHTHILDGSNIHACVVVDRTKKENKMAKEQSDNSLYPIAVLIDELRNDDVKVSVGGGVLGAGLQPS